MKKLNNRGFTLIELLAVVVILLIISVVAISSISAAIERNKVKQNETKKQVIINYGKIYYEDHKNSLGMTACIDIGKLDLTEAELEDAYGNRFNGSVSVTDGKTFTYNENQCS